ncbi:MAG: L-threonylcarbamoyladenylate synthase [Alphaproteobacteria bacterium]|nr:L-threonylcarbamoyladenylate synthase [Alphaproteobacteria bacterium]MCL2758401.1 L-threonylcarbamoyladenylate synthase [Alphaproteobacteria bacterium]
MKTTKIFGAGELGAAADIIRRGGLVAFPTETVYGLGADAANGAACAEIYAVKGRPGDNPLIIHVHDIAAADKIAVVCPLAKKLFETFAPGPITIVMQCRPPSINGGPDVGVRIPRHPVARKFLELCDTPVAAPSANISGRLSPTTAGMVMRDLDGRIDGVIKSDDDIECGLESTVVSVLGGAVRLLRAGTISPEQIEECIGAPVTVATAPTAGERALSPGQKYKHYSPSVPMETIEDIDALHAITDKHKNEKIGVMTLAAPKQSTDGWDVRVFKSPADYAKNLYRTMDEMGRGGCKKIIAILPPDTGVGRAIRDRLVKGAAV